MPKGGRRTEPKSPLALGDTEPKSANAWSPLPHVNGRKDRHSKNIKLATCVIHMCKAISPVETLTCQASGQLTVQRSAGVAA